jgi:hypothetical protein
MFKLDSSYLEFLFLSRPQDILNTIGTGKTKDYSYHQGSLPILLVAHVDTVFDSLIEEKKLKSEDICKSSTIWCAPAHGLGADDRAGVYIVSKIREQLDCSLLLTDGEETGGRGALRFAEENKDDFLAIVEFDRRGKNDAVFYGCRNIDFIKTVTTSYFQYNTGSFSDISIIAPSADIAAVNLSCGYMNEHSTGEYLILPDMLDSLEQGICLIQKLLQEGKKYNYYTEEQKRAQQKKTTMSVRTVSYSDLYADNRYSGTTHFKTTHANKPRSKFTERFPYEDEYGSLYELAEEYPDLCPYCGRPFDNTDIR